jgi:hypothetical protein
MKQPISDLCTKAPEGLIADIQNGHVEAELTFRLIFADGVRFLMARQLAEGNLQCAVEEVLTTVLEEIRLGQPTYSHLGAHVLAVVRGQIALRGYRFGRASGSVVRSSDRATEPEASEAIARLLKTLPDWEREAFVRYYALEQTEREVCTVMRLTVAEFRACRRWLRDKVRRTLRPLLRPPC